MTPSEGLDETTGSRQQRQSDASVVTAETATVDTDELLRERHGIMGSIREIYRENHFGEKYQALLRSSYRRERNA